MRETIDKKHGRLEIRRIQISTALNDYLKFPHVHQIFRITKTVTNLKTQTTTTEIIYGITSLPPDKADPDRLLNLHRGHWSIENKSHYVRDMAYDEDRCRIRTGKGPQVMAALRNFAVSLMRMHGVNNIARKIRELAHRPHLVLGMLGV
ncbi:ISAs1 family transposase [Candidatus Kaiserbacteria bacterium]|nr:ISAs1 family transposase [Candidatus Kaiserbacteria bacterium]